MKKIVCMVHLLLAVSCFAEAERFDGIFGFKLGMQVPEWNREGVVTVPLKKPTMHFDEASLMFNVKTKEVCNISVIGSYARGTSLETVVEDAEKFMNWLKKRYGIKLNRITEQENDVVRFVHHVELPNKVHIGVNIFKILGVYQLMINTRDEKMQNEAKKANIRPPSLGDRFDVNDTDVRRVLKISNIQHDASCPGAVGFDYIDPDEVHDGVGYSMVSSAVTQDGIVVALEKSVRIPYATKDELSDAMIQACRVWGFNVRIHKLITARGGTVTEVYKSVPLSLVDARGDKFKDESDRALAAFQQAKDNGLKPEIRVVVTEIPGSCYITDIRIRVDKTYVAIEEATIQKKDLQK